jgi:hypothetical protein
MRKRFLSRVLVVSLMLFGATSILGSARDFEPRDPISRIVRVIKKVLRVTPNDDAVIVPHP